MEYRKIYDGIADSSKTFELLNRHNGAPWDKPDSLWLGEWWEIEEEEYNYFLECLPPMGWSSYGFAMSEFTSGNITSGFFNTAGRWFTMSIDWHNGALRNAADHIRAAIAAETVGA